MTESYPFKVRFRWWKFGKTALIYASCSSEAVARASQMWLGVKSAEWIGYESEAPRRDFK